MHKFRVLGLKTVVFIQRRVDLFLIKTGEPELGDMKELPELLFVDLRPGLEDLFIEIEPSRCPPP